MRKSAVTIIAAFAAAALGWGCATSDVFPALEDQIAGPTGIAIDSAANRLYLVNSNEKVAYEWEEGSFQIYSIADPLNPSLIQTTHTLSFSGKVSLDTTRKLAYVPNRYSDSDDDVADRMFIFNIDEASADFMTFQEISLFVDPFGIQCCYPVDRLWVALGGKKEDYRVQFVDKDTLAVGDVNMLVDLDIGGNFTYNETTELVIIGQMGFFSRSRGGIVVVNLEGGGVAGKQPVDYWIADIRTPRGIGTDGTYVYIVSEEDESDEWVPWVFVLDPSSLTPLTDNTVATVLDKEDDGLLVASIELNERRDPQEVLLTQDYIFVTVGQDDENYVEIADRNTFAWLKEVATDEEPFAMALYAPGGVDTYLYIGNQVSNTLQVLDIATLSIVATFSGP